MREVLTETLVLCDKLGVRAVVGVLALVSTALEATDLLVLTGCIRQTLLASCRTTLSGFYR